MLVLQEQVGGQLDTALLLTTTRASLHGSAMPPGAVPHTSGQQHSSRKWAVQIEDPCAVLKLAPLLVTDGTANWQ